MQLVQPSKFFSVTIFRTRFYRQYWHARVRTWALLLFLVMLKIFDVCTVTMRVACPLLRRSIYAYNNTRVRMTTTARRRPHRSVRGTTSTGSSQQSTGWQSKGGGGGGGGSS